MAQGVPGYFTINLTNDQYGATTIASIIPEGKEPVFKNHQPRADILSAVKLTEDNLKGIALTFLKADGTSVAITTDSVLVTDGTGPRTFKVGDHLVQEWDYENEKHTYRVANIDERKKYDLR